MPHDVQHIVRDGVADEHFAGEVLRLQVAALRQVVLLGNQRQHFIAKQRVVDDGVILIGIAHDGDFCPVLQDERHGVGVKAGDDVQLYIRPALAEDIHGGHEPVKAGMALHHDAQRATATLRQAQHIAFRLFNLGQDMGPSSSRRSPMALNFSGLDLRSNSGLP